ncbi:MAG: hypothetical protein R3F14_25605 [Polyangiaceae bacterium]
MNVRRRIWSLACAGVLMLTVPVVAGCGPSTPDAKTANVRRERHARGRRVDQRLLQRTLRLLARRQDDAISGKWIRPHKDKWGEVNGQVTGDLMKFRVEGAHRRPRRPQRDALRPRLLQCKAPPRATTSTIEIAGEIGRGAKQVGDRWNAIKQRNVKPDLASIGGGGPGEIGGGDWDSENKERPARPKPGLPRPE